MSDVCKEHGALRCSSCGEIESLNLEITTKNKQIEKLAEALKVIEFYAKKENYSGNLFNGKESILKEYHGGKLARNFLKKINKDTRFK